MATEYKIENRVLYIYLDGDLDHHLAKKVKHKWRYHFKIISDQRY